MAKYTSNEQYEKDRSKWINRLYYPFDGTLLLDSEDIISLIDFMHQSIWIEANKDYRKPLTLLEDVDTTTTPN